VTVGSTWAVRSSAQICGVVRDEVPQRRPHRPCCPTPLLSPRQALLGEWRMYQGRSVAGLIPGGGAGGQVLLRIL